MQTDNNSTFTDPNDVDFSVTITAVCTMCGSDLVSKYYKGMVILSCSNSMCGLNCDNWDNETLTFVSPQQESKIMAEEPKDIELTLPLLRDIISAMEQYNATSIIMRRTPYQPPHTFNGVMEHGCFEKAEYRVVGHKLFISFKDIEEDDE